MSIFKLSFAVISIAILSSCGNSQTEKESKMEQEEIQLSASEKLIQETIAAHGGDLYNTANYSFVFREKEYQFKNDNANYTYTKTYKKGDSLIVDVFENGIFSRTVNGKSLTPSDKEKANGGSGINSVIYFATLPHKLSDKSVNSELQETVSIKGQKYDVVEVSFDQAGGGEDHDDMYYYWINQMTKKMDYFAYNYSVNDGGVRFRSAFNKRVVDGVTFQDYINFEAKVGTPLKDLPALYEAGKLNELSQIKTENVLVLNK
ncbi:MAG: hypothetical protein ACJASQ_000088 [Crocinitomicaceae bacterium]|jgi:hypothetical protein